MPKKIIGQTFMLLLPIVFLISVIWLVNIVGKKNFPSNPKLGQPIPTLTPDEIQPSSRWATDSGILEIEENLKTLSSELKAVNLKESGLLPPLLDMQIKF